jgi:tetratricopeptide (TPR) repeat protein
VIQYVTAYAYLDRGDYSEAERYFSTVIELEPNFARGWDGRGQARLFKGDYEDALLDFDKAISLKPALATAYSHRAFARMATRDSSGALRDAEKALSLNNNLVDPQIVLGRVLAEQGKLDEALSYFDRAVALAPLEGGVYWWRGRFYRDVLQDYARALEDFNRAVQYDPARAQIFLDRAVLLISGGAPVELIRGDLEEAISLSKDPLLPDVLDQAERLLGIVAEAERTGAPIIIPGR